MSNKFVGPGKLLATEEEEMAERIELREWASQKTDEELARFCAAIEDGHKMTPKKSSWPPRPEYKRP
jgi:hypothetical protein